MRCSFKVQLEGQLGRASPDETKEVIRTFVISMAKPRQRCIVEMASPKTKEGLLISVVSIGGSRGKMFERMDEG